MAPFSIFVSDHAYWRAAERFPGFDTVRIEDEVNAAFKARRVSTVAPAAITNGTFPGCLYALSEDGRRVYVVRVHKDDPSHFAVVTVMVAS